MAGIMSKAPGTPEPARRAKLRMSTRAEITNENAPMYPSILGKPRYDEGTRSLFERKSQIRRISKNSMEKPRAMCMNLGTSDATIGGTSEPKEKTEKELTK
jgi:hypothetical protein